MTLRAWLFGLAAAALVAAAAGLAVDARAYIVSLLAGISALAAAVIVAVFVADQWAERRRRDEWQRVAGSLVAAIADRLQAIVHSVLEIGLLPRGEDEAVLHEQVLARSLARIAEAIRDRTEEYAERDDLEFSSSRPLLRAVQGDVRYVREVLTPRALSLATDAELVERLTEFETSERVWSEGVRLIVDDWGYPERYAWSHAADLFAAASRLAQHVATYDYVDAFAEAVRRADT